MSESAIFIEDSFDAAHFLPRVPIDHKCHRMHGHTYRVCLEVFGEINPEMGWIVDYAEVKNDWRVLKSMLDHHTLNEIFSCGAASAVATKITLAEQSNVAIFNAFIVEEHEDNRRFAADCERWFGERVTVLRDEKYGASTLEVWRQKRFIHSGNAPCSAALKRAVLASVAMPLFGDISVIGYTAEERDRADNLQDRFPDESFYFPLIERGLTKADCLGIIAKAGIELPLMYRMGYQNANCIGCPKGGQNYWMRIREDFPERFVQIESLQSELGPGASFLRFRSGPRKGERMSLAELPPGRGNLGDESDFSCSHLCESVEREISGVDEQAGQEGKD